MPQDSRSLFYWKRLMNKGELCFLPMGFDYMSIFVKALGVNYAQPDNSLDIALDTLIEQATNSKGHLQYWSLIRCRAGWSWIPALQVTFHIDNYFLSGINIKISQAMRCCCARLRPLVGTGRACWQHCKDRPLSLPNYGQRQPRTLVVNLLVQALWLVALLTVVAWGALVVCGLGIERLAISDELKTLAAILKSMRLLVSLMIFGCELKRHGWRN